jgi:hypothetical protein
MTCDNPFLIVAVDTVEGVVANTIIDGTGDVDVVPCAGTARGGGTQVKRAGEPLGLPATNHDRVQEFSTSRAAAATSRTPIVKQPGNPETTSQGG